MTENRGSTDAGRLLQAWRAGDLVARDALFALVHNEMVVVSAALLRRENGVSLSTGDLVNEAAIRLIGLERIDWQGRAHFMALSARMMRRVLIDHVRAKGSDKRGHHKVTLVTNLPGVDRRLQLSLLEAALTRLQVIDPMRGQIVELRYFGGLSIEETGEVVGCSPATVARHWRASRAWLSAAMAEAQPDLS